MVDDFARMTSSIETTGGKLVDMVYDLNRQGYTIQKTIIKDEIYTLIYRRSIPILLEKRKIQEVKPKIYRFIKRIRLSYG